MRSTTKAPIPKESEVQKTGIAWMRAQGALVYRRNTGAFTGTHNGKRRFVRFSEPGMADTWALILVPHPDFARHAEIEFKRPGSRPSAVQISWLRKMNDVGAVAWWVDNTTTLERVYRWVAHGGRIEMSESGDYDLA